MAATREAAAAFASGLAQGKASVGLVVFGSSAIVAFPPRDPNDPGGGTGPAPDSLTARPSVPELIRAVECSSNADLAEALWLAYRELAKNPVPGAANRIVLFTVGRPNGITAEFNDPDPSRNLLRPESTCLHKPGADVLPMRGVLAQVCGYRPECGPASAVTGIRQPLNTAADRSHPDVISWLRDHGLEPVIGPPASEGCAYLADAGRVVRDIREIPDRDLYGNSTAGNGYLESALYKKERIPLDLKRVGSPYQVGLASWNAADDAARRILQDAQLDIAIMVFASGPPNTPPDETLLRRISNVPSNDNAAWARDRPAGSYMSSHSVVDSPASMERLGREMAARTLQQPVPVSPSGRRRQ
jgi:hypothetical protein